MEKQIREIIAQHVGGTYEAKQKCAELKQIRNTEEPDWLHD